jgi:DNA invertase Pin-like site-specific DNA recombinase
MFVLPELKPEEIIMYLRKSRTDDPALTVSETVAKHEQMLDDYSLRTWGAAIPEKNRFREIFSGETIEARPEIKKVLRLIEQPQYKAILIVEPQRLSRGDLQDIGYLSKILRYTKTIIITLQYSYDLTDERDRDYFERELKRGNDYLEYSKRIMMNGRTLSAEQGNFTCSRTPYGYKRVFKKDGKRKYPTLDIVPEEADIVRMIFSMYADGAGATKISYHLNAIGAKPKQGDKWSPYTIYSMLENPLYNGKIKWGWRKTVKSVEDGEIAVHRPRNHEYQIFDGKHEAIISDDLWSAVRDRRDAANSPRVKVSKELQNPLSGILWCSCGRAMIRRPYSGRCADRLQCTNQTACGNASCTMSEMLETVSSALQHAVEDFQVQIKAGDSAEDTRKADNLRILKDRLSDLERKESSLWEKFVEDGMPRKILDELLAKNAQQKQEVSALIAKAEHEPSKPDYSGAAIMFSEAIAAISNPDIPAAETNELLKACIRRITYSRERGHRESGTRSRWTMPPINLQIELNF